MSIAVAVLHSLPYINTH